MFTFIYLQKKLEKELEDIDEKHETKKRKFLESSEDFHKKLKKVGDYRECCYIHQAIVFSD